MQTFLPLPDFKETAAVLDQQRLGKQRVETLQIMQTILGMKLVNTSEWFDTGKLKPEPDMYLNRYREWVPRRNRDGSEKFKMVPVIGRRKLPMSRWRLVYYEPKGWSQHPAVLMWRFHVGALLKYQEAMCEEWVSRGYIDTCLAKTEMVISRGISYADETLPDWHGDKAFHDSHKSNLVRKMPDLYGMLWPDVDPTLEYVWPV